MNKNIVIPKNDVFFYGISLNSRDTSDVRSDIFSNILMKYLTTLKPVSSRLYRTTENSKYEYNYTFVPSKPLSWRVIKDRRIIEDVEQLSDGKYCLNYYDDNGNDVKRIIFNKQHRWVKTNYYNSIYGENLVCSLIPKELNAETVILQYITGDPYPVTLRPCPTASDPEVLSKVLERSPMPEVTALTNYGLLYFAREETFNIFSQILKEEEEKHKEAHKPPVYNTEEDIAGGFCFEVDNFDTTKSLESRFDLSEAVELSEEEESDEVQTSDDDNAFIDETSLDSDQERIQEESPLSIDNEDVQSELPSSSFSIEEDIAMAIKMISDATNIQIDQNLILTDSPDEVTIESEASDEAENSDTNDIDSTILIIPEDTGSDEIDNIDDETVLNNADIIEDEDHDTELSNVIDTEVPDKAESEVDISPIVFDEPDESSELKEIASDVDSADLLKMDDNEIDDYVSSLIDTLLHDAQSTVNEYSVQADDAFVAGSLEFENYTVHADSLSDLANKDTADSVIESNNAQYYYYGNLDESGDRTGRGRTLMSDGKIAYDGEYQNDMRHGKGSFYYKDGSLCFYGDWHENMRNGFGIGISSETGIIHTGNWRDNKPKGIGVRFDSEGRFLYLDSASEKTNGGIRVVGFGENSIIVEVWNEKTLKVVKKEIFLNDLIN